MTLLGDPIFLRLFGGLLVLLLGGTVVGQVLARRVRSEEGRKTVANMNARIRAWWVMCAVFAVALVTGGLGSVLLFSLLSVLAMREFITLVSTSRADHRTLVVAFFLFTPAQYALVATGWYGFFAVLIPVFVFFLIPASMALKGDTVRFLDRAAAIQWGLMLCVYCVSYAPALLMLDVRGWEGRQALLLFFLVFVVQLSDVLQYVWGQLAGRRKVAPGVSPNKTWEGLVGGGVCAVAVGTALWWATPFSPAAAAGMSALIVGVGFAGGLVMAAIKRDRGVKDYGTILPGHGGVLDRIDSLSFAAPIFFHVTRFFY